MHLDGSKGAYEVVNTNSAQTDFLRLIRQLDDDLTSRNGAMQKQYDGYNALDHINDVVLVYKDCIAVACGAFKEFSADTVEIKRMFVANGYRRQGFARKVLSVLESTAGERGYKYAVLETGVKQVEAINLYRSLGYVQVENYGPYAGNANSICMKKEFTP